MTLLVHVKTYILQVTSNKNFFFRKYLYSLLLGVFSVQRKEWEERGLQEDNDEDVSLVSLHRLIEGTHWFINFVYLCVFGKSPEVNIRSIGVS